jgi:hypothetical protein
VQKSGFIGLPKKTRKDFVSAAENAPHFGAKLLANRIRGRTDRNGSCQFAWFIHSLRSHYARALTLH